MFTCSFTYHNRRGCSKSVLRYTEWKSYHYQEIGYDERHFPLYSMEKVPVISKMEEAIGIRPFDVWMGRPLYP